MISSLISQQCRPCTTSDSVWAARGQIRACCPWMLMWCMCYFMTTFKAFPLLISVLGPQQGVCWLTHSVFLLGYFFSPLLSYPLSANPLRGFSWLLLWTHHFHPKSITAAATAASRNPHMDLPLNHNSLWRKNCKQKCHEKGSHATLSHNSKRSKWFWHVEDRQWQMDNRHWVAGNCSCERFSSGKAGKEKRLLNFREL